MRSRTAVRASLSVSPAEGGADVGAGGALRCFDRLRRLGRLHQRAHEIQPSESSCPLRLQALGGRGCSARRPIRAPAPLRRLFVSDRMTASAKVVMAEDTIAGLREWRREWESNPPRTGSRPLPDFESGRPTRDASPPCAAGFAGT